MKFEIKALLTRVLSKSVYNLISASSKSVFYFGNKYQCTFCRGRFRKLVTRGRNLPVNTEQRIVGSGSRPNSVCPWCGSVDRERLIYLYLKTKTNVFTANLKLLHIAPEKKLESVLKKLHNLEYLSADLVSPQVMIKMDITNIQYIDNWFDAIIGNHVLEHIPNDQQAMSELFRVLKPGGWAILQVPISLSLSQTYEDPTVSSPAERERHFGQKDHVRIYAKDYKYRLEKSGFSVEVCDLAKELGESKYHKYGLVRDEHVYFCKKPLYPSELNLSQTDKLTASCSQR